MGSIGSALSVSTLTTAAAERLMVDVGFSARVDGKTYSAEVTYSDSVYLAHDATMIGAEATGSSLTAAENNLINRINELA